MNKTITSKEDILSVGKDMVMESGVKSLNMRVIAKRCGISVGCIYNYFSSKEEVVITIIQAVWFDIMRGFAVKKVHTGFAETVETLFLSICSGSKKYPYFFGTHALGVVHMTKEKGRAAMNQYFADVKTKLLEILEQDGEVNQGFFTDTFEKKEFVNFVFSNIILLLMEEKESCDMLLKIIRKSIY